MKRVGKPIIFVLLSIVALSLAVPSLAHASASQPTLSAGDWWKYNIQFTQPGLTLTGTLVETYQGSETVTVRGVYYSTYKLSESAEGTVSASGVSGTFTLNGLIHRRTTDFAQVETTLTTVVYVGITFTETDNTTTTPVTPALQFPLSAGETWTGLSTTKTSSVQFTSTNLTPTYSNSTSGALYTYNVLSFQPTTLSAGTYEAYTVRRTSPNSTSYTDDLYSPQVNNIIAENIYSSPGVSSGTQTLTDFNSWAYSSGLTVSREGKTYLLQIRADVQPTNGNENSTTVTFTLSGTDSVTGKANVTIPKQLNTTTIKLYVDSTLVTPTITSNSTSYFVAFKLTLSTHTITLLYALLPSAGFTLSPPIIGAIIATVAVIVLALILLTLRGKRQQQLLESQPPTTTPPPTPTPSPTPPPP